MHRGFVPVSHTQGARLPGAGHMAPMRTGPSRGVPIATQVGYFFRDLRRNLRLSQPEAARRLATRIDFITALEAGDVQSLPPWPETCRIVRTYTGFVGLDPRPILHLIEILQRSAGRTPMPAQTYADEGEGWLQSAVAGLARLWEGMIGRTARVLFLTAIPVALVVLMTQTSVLEAAVSKLPPPVARFVRGAQNYVIVQLAPVRDGLRWIDVPDPRTRRGDKLPSSPQSD